MSPRTASSSSTGLRGRRRPGRRRHEHGRSMTAMVARARLATVGVPAFGEPDACPELPGGRHAERIGALRERMRARRYDLVVVFADREHSASMSFLTGFDPRFEEALLIVAAADAEPAILVGNECWGLAGAAPLPMRRHLLQDLSLPSQPRGRSRPLADLLADEGARSGARVGVVGWKTY